MRNQLNTCGNGLIILLLVLSAGCGQITTEYGRSTGLSGRTSLNGFGALRRTYEQAGFASRDVRRLSARVARTDTIVWTPRILGSIDSEVTGWFERWLRQGNRTLVYVVPDSGSETDYWIDARSAAPPKQRLEYRRRAARSINERTAWRMNRTGIPSNGWFMIEPLVERQVVGRVSGRWAAELKAETQAGHAIASEYRIEAFDADKKPSVVPFVATGPSGPNSAWSMPVETTATETPVEYAALVNNAAGDPIVVQIRSRKWKGSKIIVVGGGSLLTNYAFTRDFGPKFAAKLVAESTPAGDSNLTVGFLLSDWGQIPVSEESTGVPQASGMELLTVWPLSLVTIHAVMLGLVICLMLLPVFGRPKRIQRANLSHFGDHLDAVANLMNKSGGQAYARARISEYMRRMHGETSGPWVLPEPAHAATAVRPTTPLSDLSSKPKTAAEPTSGAADDGPVALVDPALQTRRTQPATIPGIKPMPSPPAENETDR